MVLPGGSARICMANELFGRRGILQRGPRTRGMDGVRIERRAAPGVTFRAELIAPGYKRNPRRPLCARVRACPGSKIISPGAPAFPIHPFPRFTLHGRRKTFTLVTYESPPVLVTSARTTCADCNSLTTGEEKAILCCGIIFQR